MATITVKTEQYEFSHGTKPRGQGTWAFMEETRVSDGRGGFIRGAHGGLDQIVWKTGLYGQVKRELGDGVWIVLP